MKNSGTSILIFLFTSLIIWSCSDPKVDKKSAGGSDAKQAAAESVADVADDIPKEVRKIVFEAGDFLEPAAIALPQNVDKVWVENLRDRGGIVTYGYLGYFPRTDRNNGAMKLLVAQGLIEVSEARGSYYAHYTEKMRRYDPAAFSASHPLEPMQFKVAFRKLKEITYKKGYKDGETSVYSLTFNYEFQEVVPEFPHVMTVFAGKAKTYQDIDDGLWKVHSLELADRGGREYDELGQHLPDISQTALRRDPKDILRKNIQNVAGSWEAAFKAPLYRAKLTLLSSEDSISGTMEFPAWKCSWDLTLESSEINTVIMKQISSTGSCDNFDGSNIPEGMKVRVHTQTEQGLNFTLLWPNGQNWASGGLMRIPEGQITIIPSDIDRLIREAEIDKITSYGSFGKSGYLRLANGELFGVQVHGRLNDGWITAIEDDKVVFTKDSGEVVALARK